MDLNTTRSAAISVAAVVLALASSWFPVASVGVAQAQTQTLNVAVLTPCCGNPEPNGTGLAQATTLSKPDVLQVDTFTGSVTIPIPSPNLGITSASTADIRLVLSRAGADYAECFLVLADDGDNANNNDDEGQATYLTSIVKAKIRSLTLFKQFAGSCDVDLSTGGITPGVPAVQSGDVVTASSVVSSVRTPFLQGTFVQQ